MYQNKAKARVHLLGAADVDGADASMHIETPDGRRIGISQPLWLALEHVILAAESDRSVYIQPLQERVSHATAAAVTRLSREQLRALVNSGQLTETPNPLGGLLSLSDVLAFDAQDRLRMERAMDELFDSDWPQDLD